MTADDGGSRKLIEGTPRPFDARFQQDVLEYQYLLRGILRVLAARSEPSLKRALLTVPLQILNRGRVEAFLAPGAIAIDIALLDLLWVFSFELGVADVKADPFHSMECTLSYAQALHDHRSFEQIDPYNSAALAEAQYRQLWNDARSVQRIAFENTLAFVLSHEIGHLVLQHREEAMTAQAAAGGRNTIEWFAWRRSAELAADAFGSRLAIDANYQPAQVVPWLDLVEARRSLYGESAEYPTPQQRANAIARVYEVRVPNTDIKMPDPLPPDRDMSKVDRSRSLENVRAVRAYRRNFLATLDETIDDLRRRGGATDTEAAAFFVSFTAGTRQLLEGANDSGAIDAAIRMIDASAGTAPSIVAPLTETLAHAFTGPEAVELMAALLEREAPDVGAVRVMLSQARQSRLVGAETLGLKFVLANTRFRWEPGFFDLILSFVPLDQRSRLDLKPYRLGVPARRPFPSYEERVQALLRWDGAFQVDTRSAGGPAVDRDAGS